MGVASHAGGLLRAPFQIAAPAFARRGDDHRDAPATHLHAKQSNIYRCLRWDSD